MALRAYLVWLTNESTKPAWQGYLIGLGIAACGMALALLNNGTMRLVYIGTHEEQQTYRACDMQPYQQ